MEDLALASEEDNDDDVSGMYDAGQLAEGTSSSDCEAAEAAEVVASKSESKVQVLALEHLQQRQAQQDESCF